VAGDDEFRSFAAESKIFSGESKNFTLQSRNFRRLSTSLLLSAITYRQTSPKPTTKERGTFPLAPSFSYLPRLAKSTNRNLSNLWRDSVY
jgi:hypothetical protein